MCNNRPKTEDLSTKSHGEAYINFPDGPEAYREAAWEGTVHRLFDAAVIHAEDRISWYDRKASQRAAVAKGIRWWSLFLFAMGTLTPILLTFFVNAAKIFGSGVADKSKWNSIDWIAAIPLAEVGYVLLAIAGALVIFDQFFDASGSWIRFRQSQARLEVLLADLRFAWAELMTKYGGTFADRTQAVEFVTLLRTFVYQVELLAEEETKSWAHRFNERIEAFDRNPSLPISLDANNPNTGKLVAPSPDKGSVQTIENGVVSTIPGAAVATVSSPVSVKVRLAVDDAETLDNGSLQLVVNDASVAIPLDGLIELPLEVGYKHRLVATGRRNGQALRGELELMPTIDDEGKALALELI